MSTETLALETQLLLQEVTQARQHEVVIDASEGPAVSEVEAAKLALVDKLRKKKEQNRAHQQQLYERRYGFSGASKHETTPESKVPQSSVSSASRLTPVKAAKRLSKLPVAVATVPRPKKDLLSKLRTQAVKQGAQEMAKLFGYASYEEQIKRLNKIEKLKILQSEQIEKHQTGAPVEIPDEEVEEGDEDSSSDFADESVEVEEQEDGGDADMEEPEIAEVGEDVQPQTQETTSQSKEHSNADDGLEETQIIETLGASQVSASASNTPAEAEETARETSSPTVSRRRRNRVAVDDDDDGNEADSEEDGKSEPESDDEKESSEQKSTAKKDKAAAFRQLLAAEAMQNRKHKRLRQGANFVESEAEEDEEEDVLKIGGLGDFGFGVPQAATKESKEAEEERNALKLREDDLEGIVDDLSDEEKEQQQDLDEIFRRELEEQDRQQVKEVMRNVKEGFGRNRRAFSNLEGGASARGRFNLDELVAADGDKLEAARLGLLESDEDMDDDDEDEEGKKAKGEEEEEVDEEEEMERRLRERFLNQPKIYITSSESESEGENEPEDNDDQAVKEEIESDEERERQQMKLFSERARINRRMQRMKDLQREIAKDTENSTQSRVPHATVLLDDDDEESQSLLKVLKRTDAPKAPAANAGVHSDSKAGSRGNVGAGFRFGSFNPFGMSSSIQSMSSFSRVVDNCKLFNAGSSTTTAKGFVFTAAFGSEKQVDENAAPDDVEDSLRSTPSKSTTKTSSRPAKRPFASVNGSTSKASQIADKKRKSTLFSALSSYQCVSQSEP